MNPQANKPQPMGNPAATVSPKAAKKKNLVVNYLLMNMATLLLEDLAPDQPYTLMVQEAARRTRNKLEKAHNADEMAPINLMTQTAVAIAQKLAACDDVAKLEASLDYMKKLLAGEVYIMEDVASPEDYSLTPNQ